METSNYTDLSSSTASIDALKIETTATTIRFPELVTRVRQWVEGEQISPALTDNIIRSVLEKCVCGFPCKAHNVLYDVDVVETILDELKQTLKPT